jgi:hypothetical protein
MSDPFKNLAYEPMNCAWIREHKTPSDVYAAIQGALTEQHQDRIGVILSIGIREVREDNVLGAIFFINYETDDADDNDPRRSVWQYLVDVVRMKCPAAADLLETIARAGYDHIRIGE